MNPLILFLCDDINNKELHSLHHYRHPHHLFYPLTLTINFTLTLPPSLPHPSSPHPQKLARFEAPRATQPAGGVGDDILRLRLPPAETLVQGPRSSEGSGLIASFNSSNAIARRLTWRPRPPPAQVINTSNNPNNPITIYSP